MKMNLLGLEGFETILFIIYTVKPVLKGTCICQITVYKRHLYMKNHCLERVPVSSNNKTLNARLLARVITGCHYT